MTVSAPQAALNSLGRDVNLFLRPIQMRLRTQLPSSFDILIDDLFARDGDLDGVPRPSRKLSINSLEAAWEFGASTRQPSGSQQTRKIYGEDGASPNGGPDAFLDPNKILLELGLTSKSSEADIASLRREFALRNHPDRVPPELRALATQRMMIANDLMDRYLARLNKAGE